MNVELSQFLVPEGGHEVKIRASTWNKLVRTLQALVIQPGSGYSRNTTPGGTTLSIKSGRGGGGGGSLEPFQIYANGYSNDHEPKPIVTVAPGTVIVAGLLGLDPTYFQVAETSNTLDGGAHSQSKVWLDLQDYTINFGENWPTDSTPVPWKFRYLRLGTYDALAQSGSGQTFVPSKISEIDEIWTGNIIPFWMPEHNHSRTGLGGNKLELTDDSTDGLGAAPELKIGNGAEVLEYLFEYDEGGTKRGLWGRYKE